MDTTRSERAKRSHADAVARGAKIGRPERVTDEQIRRAATLGNRDGCTKVGMSYAQFVLRRKRLEAKA